MVEYNDGSVLAQLGNPDMRTPIAHAMAWPDRIESGVDSLDLFEISKLEFEKPDLNQFPCLRLAYEAIKKGGTASAILNAANEIAVQGFLDGEVKFTVIPNVIEHALSEISVEPADSLAAVLKADESARLVSNDYIKQLASPSRKSC